MRMLLGMAKMLCPLVLCSLQLIRVSLKALDALSSRFIAANAARDFEASYWPSLLSYQVNLDSTKDFFSLL